MIDYGAQATDKQLAKIEKELGTVYRKAIRETKGKLQAYLESFAERDAEKQKLVQAGKISQADYKAWRVAQMATGKRWREMVNTLSEDYHNANQIALSIVNGHKSEAYAHNFNFATYSIEHGAKVDTSFTLYSAESVERLMRESPDLLPSLTKEQKSKMKANGDTIWQKKQLQSATVQSILQGESIPNMAKRICSELGGTNYKSAVRYARTAMTGAQNGGRQDAYKRAQDMGIDIARTWVATLDGRTRHEHRQLDGEKAQIDEPFVVDGVDIMYPGDPSAPGYLIWNCRCTTIAEVIGFGLFHDWGGRDDSAIGGMDYNEWVNEKDTYGKAAKAAENWQKKLNDLPADLNKTFSGIWKGQDVTYADWDSKKDSIQGKKDYYNQQIQDLEAQGKYYEASQMQMKLSQVIEFENHGEEYSKLLWKQEQYRAGLADAKDRMGKMAPKKGVADDRFSQARKDAAIWAKTPREADDVLRQRTGEVWRAASKAERAAIHEYTSSYSKFNEPLRGYEYGTQAWQGVGNTDLNAGSKRNGKKLNAMTDIIDKCSYDNDMWFQRGTNYFGMDRFFSCDMNLLQYGTEDQIKAELLGKEFPDYGFFSCGSSKGQGFSSKPIIMNIYAPSGTKMMYVEPFSSFGRGDGINWDGLSGQRSFGTELETIMQQGTVFRVTKVERSGGTLYLDMDVVDQLPPQRWTP